MSKTLKFLLIADKVHNYMLDYIHIAAALNWFAFLFSLMIQPIMPFYFLIVSVLTAVLLVDWEHLISRERARLTN